MIKVMFKTVGYTTKRALGVIKMAAVPRQGETVDLEAKTFEVRSVSWMPGQDVYDAYVVLDLVKL
jgi:hypothetical protein